MISLNRQTTDQLLLFEVLKERMDIEHIAAQAIMTTFRQIKKDMLESYEQIVNGRICNCSLSIIYSTIINQVMYFSIRLENEWITNGEFRRYVGVNSIQTANKILKRMGLEHRGGNRKRQYKILADILTKIR